MEKPITVNILGNDYTVKSEEDSEKLYQIAEYINKKLKDIDEHAEGLTEKKKAILVALDIASDYFQILKERDDLKNNIQQRSKTLINNINHFFQEKG